LLPEVQEGVITLDPDPSHIDDWDPWQQDRIREFARDGIIITHVEDLATFYGYREVSS
jgi:hypothetical protein